MRFIGLILFFIACSHNTSMEKQGYDGVSIDENSGSKKINMGQQIYGPPAPKQLSEDSEENINKTTPIIAVNLGPGLYKVFAHLRFLRKLKEQDLEIHILAGSSMGALVAALYAKEGDINNAEWKLFKMFEKLSEQLIPYEAKWKKKMFSLIEDEFKGMRVQDLKLPVYFPMKNITTGKMDWVSRGDLVEVLAYSLGLYFDNVGFNVAKNDYLFSIDELKKRGADIVLDVNLLGQKLNLKHTKHDLNSRFQNLFRLVHNVKDRKNGLFFEIEDNNINIDDFNKKDEALKFKFANEELAFLKLKELHNKLLKSDN